MINYIIRSILGFIGLVFLQVLILNEVSLFNGWSQPYLYIYFLIMLPVNIPDRFILFIGFFTGLIIDLFTHTPGIHTSASLTLVFVRPYLIKAIRPREGFTSAIPSINAFGASKFFVYAGLLTLVHHVWLFILLYFDTGLFFIAIGHALLSAPFTLILIYLLQYFNMGNRKSYHYGL